MASNVHCVGGLQYFCGQAIQTMKTLFVLSTLLFATQTFAQSAAEFFALAEADADAGNYKRSAKLCSKAIEQDEKNAEYVFHRGKSYFIIGKFDDAKEDIEQALFLDATLAEAYHYRAKYFFIIEHYKGCVDDNTAALKYAKEEELIGACLLNRGEAKLMVDNAEGAYDDLQAGLLLDSTNIEGIRVMARALYQLKRHEEALPYLDKLIMHDASDIGARINKGYELDALGRYQEAIAAFDDARQIDGSEPLVYSNRAHAYYGLGEYEQALKDVNKSLSNQPMNGVAYHTRALIRIAMGEKEKACKDLEHAKEMMFSEEVNDLFDKNCR